MSLGNHVIKHWSSTQSVIALSSGEAEYDAMVKTSSVALGIQGVMRDLGLNVRGVTLNTDATAAKGIASRTGLGKVRHIEVSQLWLQEKVYNKSVILETVRTYENVADALTKAVDGQTLGSHLEKTAQNVTCGRHTLALEAVMEIHVRVEDMSRHSAYAMRIEVGNGDVISELDGRVLGIHGVSSDARELAAGNTAERPTGCIWGLAEICQSVEDSCAKCDTRCGACSCT